MKVNYHNRWTNIWLSYIFYAWLRDKIFEVWVRIFFWDWNKNFFKGWNKIFCRDWDKNFLIGSYFAFLKFVKLMFERKIFSLWLSYAKKLLNVVRCIAVKQTLDDLCQTLTLTTLVNCKFNISASISSNNKNT